MKSDLNLPEPYNNSDESFSIYFRSSEDNGAPLIVSIKGSITSDEASVFILKVKDVISSGFRNPIIIDMKEIKYIASSGVGALLEILMETQYKDIKFYLKDVPERIKGIMEVLGFNQYFDFI